jgi:hypothetical protein
MGLDWESVSHFWRMGCLRIEVILD